MRVRVGVSRSRYGRIGSVSGFRGLWSEAFPFSKAIVRERLEEDGHEMAIPLVLR